MKVNNWLVFALLLVGLLVGAMSLYMASLSGVMGKMGLVGGDFSQSIKINELARQTRSLPQGINCGTWNVIKDVPSYLLSTGDKRVQLAGKLGGVRIICGIKLVQSANVERGVYTIIKGLYYLKTHYSEMRTLVEADHNKCNLLTDPTNERFVEGDLMATEGRVHEVVLSVYKQVEGARARVDELCLD